LGIAAEAAEVEMSQVAQIAKRRGAVATVTAPVRVAIYTRRSTVEADDAGLTAVDRQREAGEAFVRAQAHQNWVALTTRYDDAGYTGANTDRPALRQLMADVEARAVDVVLVNRLDRLTRSLADFVRLHEYLQKHDVHLASIVESIDTGSPAGRMMVSLLAAFGQYERELIGARTKDKIAAARRHGRFVGGALVLGYDLAPTGRRLVPNRAEAEVVRGIFTIYLETRSLVATLEEIDRRGWTLKRWVTREGRTHGGSRFNNGTLKRLLTNELYVGKVRFRGELHDGEHEGIVPISVFREAQKIHRLDVRRGPSERGSTYQPLLRGLIRCSACDRAMSHQWTRARGRLYRYYVCKRAMTQGWTACPNKSVSAATAEGAVIDRIRAIGRDPELRAETFRQALRQIHDEQRRTRMELKRLESDRKRGQREVERLVASVAAAEGSARVALCDALAKAQEALDQVATRVTEAESRARAIASQAVDESDVAKALDQFDGVWDALLAHERERLLHLLIDRVVYDQATGQLEITLHPTGIATLVDETAP
jgi:site-specific DNA recombinase